MTSNINIITFLTVLFTGCFIENEKSQLEKLTEYEGRYEYSNPKSLIIAASNFDTTLYAIIDDAQYPLKYIGKDTFETLQKSPVIFQRDNNNEVESYFTEGKVYKLLGKTIEKQDRKSVV